MRRPGSSDSAIRELLAKTSATRDGHESFAPDICPNVPPWPDNPAPAVGTPSMCSSNEPGMDFPPVKSPLLMRARRVSLDSEASSASMTPAQKPAAGGSMQIGAEEPEWLRRRKQRRLLDEQRTQTVQEIDEHLQYGSHYLQRDLKIGSKKLLPPPPPPELFGTPSEEKNVVYIWNLDSKLVSSDGLQQDLRQQRDLPEIQQVRLPLRYKFENPDSDRKPVGNRGYAYLEFKTSEEANASLRILQGMKINQIPLRASISNPKAPIYEPKTLFLPSLPKLKEENFEVSIKEAVEQAYQVYILEVGEDRKRYCQCSSSSFCPWQVLAVRFKASQKSPTSETMGEDDQQAWSYAYVECQCKSNIIEILNWQYQKTHDTSEESGHKTTPPMGGGLPSDRGFKVSPFSTRKGCELLFAPSIPKKERAHVTGQVTRRPIAQHQLARTLHLSNLPKGMKLAKLNSICSEYGLVKNIAFPPDADGQTQGWALVEYSTNVEATSAFENLQVRKCAMKTIHVKPSTSVITTTYGETTSSVNSPCEEDLVTREEGSSKKKFDQPAASPAPLAPPAFVKPVIDLSSSTRSTAATATSVQTNEAFRKMLGL